MDFADALFISYNITKNIGKSLEIFQILLTAIPFQEESQSVPTCKLTLLSVVGMFILFVQKRIR